MQHHNYKIKSDKIHAKIKYGSIRFCDHETGIRKGKTNNLDQGKLFFFLFMNDEYVPG